MQTWGKQSYSQITTGINTILTATHPNQVHVSGRGKAVGWGGGCVGYKASGANKICIRRTIIDNIDAIPRNVHAKEVKAPRHQQENTNP